MPVVSTFQLCKSERTKKPWWRVYKGIEMWAHVDVLTGVCEGPGKWSAAMLFKKKRHSQSNRLGKNVIFGSILTGYKWNKFVHFWAWENNVALNERQDDENSKSLGVIPYFRDVTTARSSKTDIQKSGDWHKSKHQVWSKLGWRYFLEKEKSWKERLELYFYPA